MLDFLTRNPESVTVEEFQHYVSLYATDPLVILYIEKLRHHFDKAVEDEVSEKLPEAAEEVLSEKLDELAKKVDALMSDISAGLKHVSYDDLSSYVLGEIKNFKESNFPIE